MLKRWGVYFAETVQPATRLLVITVSVLGIFFMTQAGAGSVPLVVSIDVGFAAASAFLLLLYWRVRDEFKDAETDKRFFPDRPVPSGRVTLEDLRILAASSMVLGLVLNLAHPVAWAEFVAVAVYVALMGRWFFVFERWQANNRLIAFVTHSPANVLLNVYVVAIAWRGRSASGWVLTNLVVVMWFCCAGFAWEFARKCWAPAQEMPGYQTYSQLIGYRNAVGLVIAAILLHVILTAGFYRELGLSLAFVGVLAALASVVLAVCLVFAARPRTTSPFLRPSVEAYMLLTNGAVIFDLCFHHGVRWT